MTDIESEEKKEKKKQSTVKVNDNRRQFSLCAKKLQDWGPQFTIEKQHVFNRKEFKPSSVLDALAKGAAPKINVLLKQIKQLDESDMKKYGHLFKHFIFSDIDEGGYGARMVISALIASGYTNMIPDMQSVRKPVDDGQKHTFVYLSGKPIEINGREATFDAYVQAYDKEGRPLRVDYDKKVGLTGPTLYRPKMKKYVTDSFNDSENKYGDHIRFIVLDKKFKEGLDLFDVKYAHLMEAMTPSQTTQAEGRGTRMCGQKNLAFKTNYGWSLHVYHYLLRLPKQFAAAYGWSNKYEDMLKSFSDADERTELLTNIFTQLSEKSAVDRALTYALPQQYVQNGGKSSSPKKCEAQSLELPSQSDFCKMSEQEQRSEYKRLSRKVHPDRNPTCRDTATKRFQQLNNLKECVKDKQDSPSTQNLTIKSSPNLLKNLEENNLIKSRPSPKKCDADMVQLPSQSEFCEMSEDERHIEYKRLSRKLHPDNPACLKTATQRFQTLNNLKDCSNYKSPSHRNLTSKVSPKKLLTNENEVQERKDHTVQNKKDYDKFADQREKWIQEIYKNVEEQEQEKKDDIKSPVQTKEDVEKEIDELSDESGQAVQMSEEPPTKKAVKLQNKLEEELYQKLRPVTEEQIASLNINDPPLTKFQKTIAMTFGHAELPKLPIQSECPNPLDKATSKKREKAKLNMTQDFLRRYITPATTNTPSMVTKGMLLWHSTGSGKTCGAVAVASNFEEAGYVVVYVCPTSLTSEIKKNVWESIICHGRNLKKNYPDLENIKSQYDDCWLGGPMSYRTFTNLIQDLSGKGGGNQILLRKLRAFDDRQGITRQQRSADPFYKMLIIIDEVQKLYSNELNHLEQPHMPTVENYLYNSFARSDKDAAYKGARIVVMSATPISKSPFELFQILNLLRTKEEALPLSDAEFKLSPLADEKGMPNNAAIMEKLQGYISFLDLSANRARFAQKKHHQVEVKISGTFEPVLPPFDRKSVLAGKQALTKKKLAECTMSKLACTKKVKNDPEIMAFDSQLKSVKKTKKKKYDKTTDYTQLGSLQECISRYLNDSPKVDFYPSENEEGHYAGFKYIENGPKGSGYYNISAPEPAEKVAEQVVESIDDVKKELETTLEQPVKVDDNFIPLPQEVAVFTGWEHKDGPKGKGYYVEDFKNEKFVPSDNNRGSIAGWIYRKGVEGLGYYASSFGRALGDRIADKFGYTRKVGGKKRRKILK